MMTNDTLAWGNVMENCQKGKEKKLSMSLILHVLKTPTSEFRLKATPFYFATVFECEIFDGLEPMKRP